MKLKQQEINQLKEQVRREYQLSYNTIVRKRLIFRQQDELLNGIIDQNKIDTKTMFYTIYSKMAVIYSDDIQVKWKQRQMSGSLQAENLNKLARFDAGEMDVGVMNYEVQLNRLQRGVGIRLMTGWDNDKQCAKWQVMDTRTWCPDPRGWFKPEGFRYHGFELSEFKYNLREEDGFDMKEVEKCYVSESPETILTRVYAQKSAGLFPATEEVMGDTDNKEIAVYYHLTRWNGKPVFTVWGNNIGNLIRYEEIGPVYENEKKNNNLIPFPITLNYFCPKKGDPFGSSLADLVQIPHRYKNIMANLMFLREKDYSLGDDVLYDTNIIKNKNDLSTPTLSRKFIGADGSRGPLQNAISIIPKNPVSGSTYNFMDKLDSMVQMATGMDARQMGIQGNSDITLGEAQQIQANNNVKSLFEIRINNIGEKQFRQLCYRGYKQYFPEAQKKVIRVTNSMGTQNLEFTKKDIIGDTDPDIEIVSKSELETIRQKQLAQLTPLLLGIINNPNKSEISRTMAERKLLELAGVEQDEQYILVNPSWEEIDARSKLPLLNNNDMDGVKIDPSELQGDQMTYITIFQQALPTEATKVAIEARKQVLIAQGKQVMQPQGQTAGMQGQAQNLALQNSNQQMQQQAQNQTRQDVMQ